MKKFLNNTIPLISFVVAMVTMGSLVLGLDVATLAPIAVFVGVLFGRK